jgi:arginase
MQIAIVAVPYDVGQRNVGTGLGPARLLEAGLANELREAGHIVREASVQLRPDAPQDPLLRVVALQDAIAWEVRHALSHREFPVVLAGNCSSAVGTLTPRPDDAGVIWFDAHGDFNTPQTTITGYLDGMALAMATGRAHPDVIARVRNFKPVEEQRVLLIGARDLDAAEAKALDSSQVQRIAEQEVARLSARLAGFPATAFYVHVDLDVLDPDWVRVNRYAPAGGLSPRALIAAVETITQRSNIYALAVTAYDPSFDADGRARQIAFDVVKAAVPRDLAWE